MLRNINIKRVLYIGNFDQNYPRNWVILKALGTIGIKVYILNFNNCSNKRLFYTFIKHLKRINSINFDLLYFFSVSTRDLPLFLLTKLYSKYRRIPLIYDYFISKYQTFYEDRKLFTKENIIFKYLKCLYLYCLDFFECRLSDKIILDTLTHIRYFKLKFHIKQNKFERIFVGTKPIFNISNNLDYKGKDNAVIKVGFWGTFIPLHGIEFIIKAADLLRDNARIIFTLVGVGQTFKRNYDLATSLNLKNLIIDNRILLDKLPDFISECNIGLGIFGKGDKPLCVIPNKIFEAIPMKVPMITANTPAIKELFKHKENIYLCQRANPKSLAKAILTLVNNFDLRHQIAENAYEIYKEKTCIRCIAEDLKVFFLELCSDYHR